MELQLQLQLQLPKLTRIYTDIESAADMRGYGGTSKKGEMKREAIFSMFRSISVIRSLREHPCELFG